MEIIPGILRTKRTFGRCANGKLLYKFQPDNREIEPITIPYEIKNVGFSKVNKDQYVLVNYQTQRLNKTIGPVDILENFYTYQLYCKNLKIPVMKPLQNIKFNCTSKLYNDRTNLDVFSIDGPTTKDFDDAFGISVDAETNATILSIYISNVGDVLDGFNLWDRLTDHISNIYMPNERITLLSSDLCELCSLTAGKTTSTITLDIYIKYGQILKHTFNTTLIKPYKNYSYDDPLLLEDKNYIDLLECIKVLTTIQEYQQNQDNDASNNVEYLMRYMNYYVAQTLYKNKTGIFRTMYEPLGDIYPSNSYITWNTVDGIPYLHCTSPMRRLVDILNIIKLQELQGLKLSGSLDFYNKWIIKLDYINTMSRNIRRVQNDCTLLSLYPTIKDTEFDGKILESETKFEDNCYTYTVYLPDLRLTCKIKSLEILMPTNPLGYPIIRKYKLYMFSKESSFRKKIRLQLI